ncbi:YqzE family protein [Alteribacillus sp. JSM 102045]|uniref:YqzE family protein n=1 Tax=Alteribacillus sp. JSM 102045 TaxID=1562101 RepID=UPI0035BFD953
MKPNPFVKYITQELVEAIDNRLKKTPNVSRSRHINNFWTRWFGILPYSVSMVFKKKE